MILKDNFYKVLEEEREVGILNAIILLDPGHIIFKAHFPGQPVVPGVCWMQIIKELLETALDKSLQLVKADDIKFLQLVDPREQRNIIVKAQYDLTSDDAISVTISINAGAQACLKSRMKFAIK